MFNQAFVEQRGGHNKFEIEEELLIEYLQDLNVPITYFHKKEMLRRSLPLTKESLVVGRIESLEAGMKQLGVSVPQANDYPKSLQKYLFRKTWEMKFADLEKILYDGMTEPFFAKPKYDLKKFTGRLFFSPDDLHFLAHTSRQTELLCSEEVEWLAEYRVYVVNSEIRHVGLYYGDPDVKLSMETVEAAIKDLDAANESYIGYGIDFGILTTGETALVEMNDGYGLGAYDISAKDYGELIWLRWEEILKRG